MRTMRIKVAMVETKATNPAVRVILTRSPDSAANETETENNPVKTPAWVWEYPSLLPWGTLKG